MPVDTFSILQVQLICVALKRLCKMESVAIEHRLCFPVIRGKLSRTFKEIFQEISGNYFGND